MKIKTILFSLLTFLAFSCSNEGDEPFEEPSASDQHITLRAGSNDVTVLFFAKANNQYAYIKTALIDVSDTVNLNYGDYKCLFYKFEGDSIEMLPATISATTLIGDIKFNALVDQNRSGLGNYVLPVEELWLPENINDANVSYNIPAVNTISNSLARAVSQVIIHVKKVDENGDIIPLSTAANGTIINLGDLTLDISGVGTTWDITGPSGVGETYFETAEAILNQDGTVTYNGPFVFPAENNADIKLTFTAIAGGSLSSIAERTIAGPLERNKKLEITLILKEEADPRDGDLDIEVEVIDMEDNTDDGDNGVWE